MPAKDSLKTLENFLGLVPTKIENIAAKLRSKPAANTPLVELLNGLSVETRKLAADIAENIRSLPAKGRAQLLTGLEKSGVANTVNRLTPVLKSQGLLDDCLALHESSKTLYALSTIIGGIAGVAPEGLNFTLTAIAGGLEGYGLIADIAAQICDEKAAAAAEAQLNEMEDTVKRLEQKIDYIMDLPDGAEVPPVPPDEKPTSLTALRKMLEVAKKFYKFEGSFTPTFEKDKQLIRIGPLATSSLPTPPVPILITGFIDLGGMQDNDVVSITTRVLEPTPSPSYVIWRVKTFTGHQSSGMKHFQDFADLLEVPGDGVDFLIAQSASSHNFDPGFLLTIPYQFLVETTVLPDFNVS